MAKRLKKTAPKSGSNWHTKSHSDSGFGEVTGYREGATVTSSRTEKFTDERGVEWPVERSFDDPLFGSNVSFKQIIMQLGGQKHAQFPYKESPYAHAAIKVFAQALSSVELLVYPNDEVDAKPLVKTHELMKVLKKPNTLMTGSMLLYAHAVHRKLDGEDFWFLMDKNGRELKPGPDGKIPIPGKIWPVRGSLVKQKLNEVGEPSHYAYEVQLGGGKTKERVFDARTVIRFADYDPYDPTRGLGDIEACVRQLDLMFQAERYQSGVLKNSGDPGGWVKTKNRLTTTQKEELQRGVDSVQQNPENAKKWRVIDSDADYIPNKLSPKDMEYSELLKYGRDATLSSLGVPPPLVQVWDKSTYNNVFEAKQDLWLGGNGVMAVLRQIEDVLNTFLIPNLDMPGAESMTARFNTSSVEALKKDVSQAVEAAARTVKHGVGLNFNETAEMMGIEFIPPRSGNTHYVSPDLIAVPGVGKEGESDDNAIGSRKLVDSNTSQVIVNLVADIQAHKVPKDSGIQILITLFGLKQDEATLIIGTAGDEPPVEEEDPNDPPNPDEGEGEEEEDGEGEEEEEDEDKSIRGVITKADEDLYNSTQQECIVPSTRAIKPVAVRFLRSYKKAYMDNIRKMADSNEKSFAEKDLSESEMAYVSRIVDSLLLDKEEWIDRFSKITNQPIREAYLRALANAAKQTGSFSLPISSPEVVESLSSQIIKLSEGEVSRITEAVRRSMIKVLEESVSAGGATSGDVQLAIRESLEQLEASVTGAFKNLNQRALTIARTEATSSTNSARMLQFKEAGIERHQWLNSGGTAQGVRDAHLDQPEGVGGEIVRLGEKFSNGLRYPGDPEGSVEEVASCRCITKALLT